MRMSGEDYAAGLPWKTPHRRKVMHLPSFKLQETQHILHIAFGMSDKFRRLLNIELLDEGTLGAAP